MNLKDKLYAKIQDNMAKKIQIRNKTPNKRIKTEPAINYNDRSKSVGKNKKGLSTKEKSDYFKNQKIQGLMGRINGKINENLE